MATLPGIVTELAVPLRVGASVVGALNIESERALPDEAARLLEPLASVLAPLAEELRRGCSTCRLSHVGSAEIAPSGAAAADTPRRGRSDGSVLTSVVGAAAAIEAETTVDAICDRLCKSLVFVVGATACSASRVVGDYLVDATEHALREVWLGDEAAYRIADFPLTAEALRTGQPRAASFLRADVDPAEAFILRELGMNALLLLPLRIEGRPWGLVELYEMRLRQFTEDDVAIAVFLTTQAERRLGVVGGDSTSTRRPAVYELPSDAERRTPGTR